MGYPTGMVETAAYLDRLRRLLAWAVPASLRAGPDSERVWVMVGCMLLADLIAAPLLLWRVSTGTTALAMWPTVGGILAATLGLVALHLWPERRLTTFKVFWGLVALLIPASASFGDGQGAASMPAVVIVPVAVVYLLGARSGLVAVVGVSGVLLALALAAASGVLVYPPRTSLVEERLMGISVALSTSWMAWFIVWAYETQRQRAMEALQLSERRYLLALRAEGAGVAEWRLGAEVCFCDPRLRNLLDLPGVGELVPCESIFASLSAADGAALRVAKRRALEVGVGFRVSTEVPRSGLASVHLAGEGVAEVRDDGRRCVVAIVRDITEERRVSQAKDDFVATVSHELRTPLTTIRGAVGMLDAGVGATLDDRGRHIVELALRGTDRLTALVNDLLDAQRLELGRLPIQLSVVDLAELGARVVDAHWHMAQEHQLTLEATVTGSGSTTILSDARRVEQVLTNLVSNACKFAAPGTVVHVRVLPREWGVRLEVEDCGAGIPRSFQPHVFEKFAQARAGTTRDQGGTGLGLSISRALTLRLGGKIDFESVESKGTTFWVELPLVTPDA